jgi:hypothetical protein
MPGLLPFWAVTQGESKLFILKAKMGQNLQNLTKNEFSKMQYFRPKNS